MADFIASLAAVLLRDPLREKLLVAPSYRVGRQWLDRVALTGGTVANVRTTTLRRLFRDLAEPALSARGLRLASRAAGAALAAEALDQVRRSALWGGYFTSLPPSLELAENIARTLDDMETAGVADKKIAAAVGHPGKGAELAELYRAYRRERRARGLAGPAALLAAALDGVLSTAADLPLLIAPVSLVAELHGLERRILQAWPADRKDIIPDAAEPSPAGWRFFRADRIENEVREVFRRIQRDSIALDRVELVSTDAAGYDPVIVTVALEVFGGRPEDLPLTFHLGLPGWLSRPGRLLAAWLGWLERDCPPEGLARMVESGLLADGWRQTAPGVSADALAALLRRLPLHGDAASYQTQFRADRSEPMQSALVWLADLLGDIVPPAGAAMVERNQSLLVAAGRLTRLRGPGDAKLDAYAAAGLVDRITEWLPYAGIPGFDVWSWLGTEAAGQRVMGLGPMPGRAHVSDIASGGQTGRPSLFVLGLDDKRFPGSQRQDPVLLDDERSGLSPALRQSGHRRRQREASLARLLGQAGGDVCLSHAGSDAGQGLFPATQFTAWVETAGKTVVAASLLPNSPAAALRRSEDWLTPLLHRPVGRLPAVVLTDAPHLAAGEAALAARQSAFFTGYDGLVPTAGAECFAPNGDWHISPTELENFATCPRDFFYRHVLGVRPPDRFEPTPGRWLPGNERGTLLHDLFQDFLTGLDTPVNEAGRALIAKLESALARYRKKFPPRDQLAYSREERELRETCEIFIADEAERQRSASPLYFEVSIGSDRQPVTPWDRREPVEVLISDARRLRLKGRIDRIDRLHDGSGLVIMDYKSGSAKKHSATDVLMQGRQLQPLLYCHMLTQARADAGQPEPVKKFLYYFPMPREEGKVISFTSAQLGRDQLALVDRLLVLLEAGYFPMSTDNSDLTYSDYAEVHSAGGDTTRAARAKLGDPAAPVLAVWADLRKGNAHG